MHHRARAIIAYLTCTLLWGAAAVATRLVHINPLTLVAVSCLVQISALVAIVLVRRRSPVGAPWRLLFMLGACSAATNGLYFSALRMAPAGLVAALHLTAPLVLLLIAVRRGERRMGHVEAAVCALIVAGVVLSAKAATHGTLRPMVLAGLGLALMSAVSVAASTRLLAGRSLPGSQVWNTIFVCMLCGTPYLPHLITAPATHAALVRTAVITLLLWTPAALISWWAVRHLTPGQAGAIGLTEALATAVIARVSLNAPLTPVMIAAGSLILLAVMIEVTIGAKRTAPVVRHAPATPHHALKERGVERGGDARHRRAERRRSRVLAHSRALAQSRTSLVHSRAMAQSRGLARARAGM